ncbi:uncharacterized protein LOC126834186 [Adelges cooleyi]|uniref:uncharacterized protein LOC126834186 n=1 Tax=Adelges cooleyi TaxID=133065 RepID=UPI0021800E46|nr:uncharacterized protein LOC126834186 [Adelges cooleyi]
MKRFCVLISFVVVNILANKLVEYKRELVYTNRQIKRVPFPHVHLQSVIRTIVFGDKPMAHLSYMFAAPAKIFDGSNIPNRMEVLQQSIDSQKVLQTEISKKLGVPVFEKGLASTALRKVGCTCESIDVDSFGLIELQIDRILLFREAAKQLIRFVSTGTDADFKKDDNRMCRLKGLYRSILYPDTYITLAEVVGDECRLTGIDTIVHTVKCRG